MSRENQTRLSLRLPSDLSARLDLELYDPILKKPAYGARQQLIIHLIELYLKSQNGELRIDGNLCRLPTPEFMNKALIPTFDKLKEATES